MTTPQPVRWFYNQSKFREKSCHLATNEDDEWVRGKTEMKKPVQTACMSVGKIMDVPGGLVCSLFGLQDLDGFVQDCGISIASAMEIPQFCTVIGWLSQCRQLACWWGRLWMSRGISMFFIWNTTSWWLWARLWYLHCWCNVDTTVLHKVIDWHSAIQCRPLVWRWGRLWMSQRDWCVYYLEYNILMAWWKTVVSPLHLQWRYHSFAQSH